MVVRVLMVLAIVCFSSLHAFGMTITPDLSKRVVAGHDSLNTSRDEGFVVLPERLTEGPLTLISRVFVRDDASRGMMDTFWLAGLSTDGNVVEPDFGVVWSKERTWIGIEVWRIRLNRHIDLELATPKAGHVYRTVLSYLPRSGKGAVLIEDETESNVIYTGTFEADFNGGEVFAAAGAVPDDISMSSSSVEILQLDAYSAYVPLQMTMEIMSKSSEPLPRKMFDRSEVTSVRLVIPDVYPAGEFWISARHHDTGRVERHGPIPSTSRETEVVVTNLELPGKTTLTVDYYSEGHRWLSESWDLSGGWLRGTFDKVEVDYQKNLAHTTLTLQSDHLVPEIDVAITASMRAAVRPGIANDLEVKPFEPVEVFRGPVEVFDDGVMLPLTIPLGDRTPFVFVSESVAMTP